MSETGETSAIEHDDLGGGRLGRFTIGGRTVRVTSGLDIIGDLHGCESLLVDRLTGLGYERDPSTGVYGHRERRAVFVGDLIDKGGDQLRVLEIVKGMVDSGSAHAVMGNHEFDAIAYTTKNSDTGEPLLVHDEKNSERLRAFLEQLSDAQQKEYVGWFLTLPLWLDFGGVRVVHACWDQRSMGVVLDACGSNRLTVEGLVAAANPDTLLGAAVDVLLNGPELDLVEKGLPSYRADWQDEPRGTTWIRWWRAGATTLRELAETGKYPTVEGNPYPELSGEAVDDDVLSYVYNADVPVFFGHYSREGTPEDRQAWTDRAACVDFSGNRDGVLVAYRWNGRPSVEQQINEAAPRWDGERIITLENFVSAGGGLDALTCRR